MTRNLENPTPGPADDGRAKRDAELRLTAETIGSSFERVSARAEYLEHLKELGKLLKSEVGLARAPLPKHLDLTIDDLHRTVSVILDHALLRADSQETQLVSGAILVVHPTDQGEVTMTGLRRWEVDWVKLVGGYLDAIDPIHEDRTARLKELYRNISDGTLELFREEGGRTYRSIDYVIEIEKGRAREIGQIDNEEEHQRAREVFSRSLLRSLKGLDKTDDQRTVSERSLDVPFKELFRNELGRIKAKRASDLARGEASSSQGESSLSTTSQIAEFARQEMLKSVRTARITSHRIGVAYLEYRKEIDKDIPKGSVLLAFRAARRFIDRNKEESTFPPPIPDARERRLDNYTLGRYLCSALWTHRKSLRTI